jgi:putative tryptophan/tyrosine transport system substrate-binding protein
MPIFARRDFIFALAGTTVAWPRAAHAQQPAMPVVGLLINASPEPYAPMMAAFRQGLGESGYVDGKNVAIEYRWAENQIDRLPALTTDLVGKPVAVIAAAGAAAAHAAKAATTAIPIVFLVGSDPVKSGLVASLNRPVGNLTGVGLLINTLAPKQLEVLHELAPKAMAVGMLVNPGSPNAEADTGEVQAAARSLGLQLLVLNARTATDIDAAFATLVQRQAGGLIINGDPLFFDRGVQIIALAARHAVPTIYPVRDMAVAGGLMSYGTNLADAYYLVGVYVARILKGAKPADLPVLQMVKVELVLNLKTAKTLGLTLPLPLLGRADEVIE